MIDSHCHLNDKRFSQNVEQVIKKAKENGVKQFLVVGYDLFSSLKAVKLSEKYVEIYAAVGIHPSDIKKMKNHDLEEIEKLLKHKKVIALGEIGLDYYWDKDVNLQNQQKEFFVKQIQLANKYKKPILVHMRDASFDTLEVLKSESPTFGGIMHCYSGSAELVKEFIILGMYISLAGPVTFLNAKTPKEVAKIVPLDRLLIETDSPYLAPHPYRGQSNEPGYLYLIAEEIAKIKNIPLEDLKNKTTQNFKRLFNF